jgi:VanZ family protein
LSGFFAAFGLPPAVVHVGNLIVRKSAHFVEYAVLSVLIFRAARVTWPRRAEGHALLVAVGAAAAGACVDELRQYVISASRTGSVRDVVVDAAGALAGAAYLYRRARRPGARRWKRAQLDR